MSQTIVSRQLAAPPGAPQAERVRPVPPSRVTTPISAPSVPAILMAIGGLGVFGFCAAIGAPSARVVAWLTTIPVAGLVGAMVLTGPALVAGHLFLRPNVATEIPVAALGRGLTAAGSVGLGLAPAGLFLVATTGLWPMVLIAGFAAVGLSCAAVTLQMLRRATGDSPGFVVGWAVLAALVALRVAVAVGQTALEVV